MPRVLKQILPPHGTSLTLPAGSRILHVGLQRPSVVRSAPNAPIITVDPTLPRDIIDSGPGSEQYVVDLIDKRSKAQSTRVAVVVAEDENEAQGILDSHYDELGYDLNFARKVTVSSVANPLTSADPASAALSVPVIWYQEPSYDDIDASHRFSADNIPMVSPTVYVIPTGEEVPHFSRYVGTLQRPQRLDPSKEYVVHVYLEEVAFLFYSA